MMKTIYLAIFVFLFYKRCLVAGCGEGCHTCTENGDCEVCETGYWLNGTLCEQCATGCTQCSLDGYCSTCSIEYWLSEGACERCATNCIGCSGATQCIDCVAGYRVTWNQCTVNCSSNCDQNGCDNINGPCHYCIAGYYGEYCNDKCEHCENEQCVRTGCISGCQQGFYQEVSGTYSICLHCSSNCNTCLNTKVCSECESGFYILTYDINGYEHASCNPCISQCGTCTDVYTCTSCQSGYSLTQQNTCEQSNCAESSHCLNSCDNSGNCIDGCEDGWTGQTCSSRCSTYCKTCEQGNPSICTQCFGEYYSISCNIPCSQGCKGLEGSDTCRLNDGLCQNGCVDGYWGQTCDAICNANCVPTICTQMDGHCNSCNRMFYGDSCEDNCHVHCHDDGSATPVCFKSNGSCSNGCMQGYSGDTCDVEDVLVTMTTPTTATTDTQSTSTDPAHHTVTSAPTDTQSTSTDPAHHTVTSASTDTQSTSTDPAHHTVTRAPVSGDDTVIIGAGAGGGVVIIIVVVILIICYLRRRNKKEDEQFQDGIILQDANVETTDVPDTIYAKPNKQMLEATDDYIYAQPNKPKTKQVSKKVIGEPRTISVSAVTIDLESEKVTKDTAVVELEDVDEGTIVLFKESEIDMATSDTYYNTAGLLRSRIQISQLLEYTRKKNDYENEFAKLPTGLTRPCTEALKPDNRHKNRYNGIYAYDATRVTLQSRQYINANHVDGYNHSQAYIASLGPTSSTMDKFVSFWEMIWQEKTQKIVMLTNLKEKDKMKCEKYWPDPNCPQAYGDFNVCCEMNIIFSDFTVRKFTISKNSKTRHVTQYHYTAWPDKTVPDTVVSLVEFRDKVEHNQSTNLTGPIVVHCSAGIGRTGTYIALDIMIKEGKAENSVDIFGCALGLRGQRVSLVQNAEQYEYLHHCVLYALTCESDPLPVELLPGSMRDEMISTQYEDLMNLPSMTRSGQSTVGNKKTRKAGRNDDDIPDDRHCVKLVSSKNNYINAVYVNGYTRLNSYISAQTPTTNTVEDFLAMVVQEKCACIVCLDEDNISDKTLSQYIPPANKVSTFGRFQVACTSSDPKAEYIARELKISRIGSPTSEEIKIRHYQFNLWKKTSIPDDVGAFLTLITDVEQHRTKQINPGPVLVHCRNGGTRSGLFCVISIMLEKVARDSVLSVVNTVSQVRARRRSAIQDYEQFRFCYRSVVEFQEKSDSNIYYNTIATC